MRKKRYLVICIIFCGIFVVSSVMLFTTLYRYKHANAVYGDLQDRYVSHVSRPDTQGAESVPKQETQNSEGGDVSEWQPEESGETEVLVTPPISVDFDALLQENGDVVGWLYCENTPINYPVVRCDDNDYYLRRDLYGKYLISGTLFVDYRCSPAGTGQNFIIYGHNMTNKTMFGTLADYKQQAYYDENPVLYYLTPEKNYMVELFAGEVTSADSEVYTPSFGSGFSDFLKDVKDKSTFNTDVSVDETDNIVTLSTCSYEFGNARYVVFGKLVCISG